MSRRRDVSGLWEAAPVGSDAPVDRSPGISPPPRTREPAIAPATAPRPAPTPASPLESEPTSIGLAAVPNDAATEALEPESVEPQSATIKTGLSFTAEQIKWLNKAADRRELWLGDLIAELLNEFGEQAAGTPLPRRTRKRKGSNYTQLQVYLEPTDRAALDALAADVGRSRAALGRLLVDLAMAAAS